MVTAAYLNLFISNTRRHHFDDGVSICYVFVETRENTITANWQSEKPSATWLKEVQFNSEIEPQIWTFFHEFFVVVSHFGGLNNARYHHTGYMKGRFFMIYIIFASPIMMIVSPFETKIRICIEKKIIFVKLSAIWIQSKLNKAGLRSNAFS